MTTQDRSASRPLVLARRPDLSRARDYGVVIALVALFVVLSLSSDIFLTSRNLLNLAEQWAPVSIMALGLTFVLIAGNFDLSIGAMFALAGIVGVKVANGSPLLIGVLAPLAVGAGLGLGNGLLGTVGRVNPFVATLGTSIVFAGLAAATTNGTIQIVTNERYDFVQDKPLGVNVSIWILAAAIVVSSFVLTRTTFGRYIFAIGSNREASRLMGVRVQVVQAATFAIAGLGAGLAALIVTSRSLSASASGSTSMAFNVWTAVLLGGNSMVGGEGAVWRTMTGVALLALIANGFDLLGVDPTYQEVLTGAILLAAVGLDAWTRKKRA